VGADHLYLDQLVLRNPQDMLDIQKMKVDEIIDYLVALGERLDVASNPHLQFARDICIEGSGLSVGTIDFMFRNLAAVLKREILEQIVENNIGMAVLDGWQPCLDGARRVDVRAFGSRAVHINAGNAASLALHGTLTNALLKSDAIIKLPSNDPFTASAIALTMIEMAPDHPVTRHLSVAYWQGGNQAFESRLFRPVNVEKIIAWGGFASMKHIRTYLAPGLDLIALDPKISASIIGREVFESEETMRAVAGRLAMDVGGFNQEACVNSRLTYVEVADNGDGIALLNRFGELVYEAIQNLPAEVSGAHPAFDSALREEISDLRFNDLFKIVGGKDSEGAVIVSQEAEPVEFSEQLGCRVANLVPVRSIDEALDYITVHTQTVGVYPDALKERIRDACAVRGAQRLTSLGGALGESMAQPHDAIEQFRRMVRWVVDETINAAPGSFDPSASLRMWA